MKKGDLGGDRTLDPMIKSHLLYQLSYEVNTFCRNLFLDCGCKDRDYFEKTKTFSSFFCYLIIKFINIRRGCPLQCNQRHIFSDPDSFFK